jgi:hypothetical protein
VKLEKILVLIVFFVVVAFAEQERQPDSLQIVENFSLGQRVGTYALNFFLPGVGSIAIMDDWTGAGIQWGLFGSGCALIVVGFTRDNIYDGLVYIVLASGLIQANYIFNIARSIVYDKPGSLATYQKSERKEQRENFRSGQRAIAAVLNTILPGIGSIAIMDDWSGLAIQWLLLGGGILLADEIEYAGLSLIAYSFAYGIYRPITYDKPSSNIALSVLPNKRGELMPYIFYSVNF